MSGQLRPIGWKASWFAGWSAWQSVAGKFDARALSQRVLHLGALGLTLFRKYIGLSTRATISAFSAQMLAVNLAPFGCRAYIPRRSKTYISAPRQNSITRRLSNLSVGLGITFDGSAVDFNSISARGRNLITMKHDEQSVKIRRIWLHM